MKRRREDYAIMLMPEEFERIPEGDLCEAGLIRVLPPV
jgi:hypothetical protein